MPWSVIAGVAASNNGTDITFVKTAGLADGDRQCVAIMRDDELALTTPATGFNVTENKEVAGDDRHLIFAEKRITDAAAEPANYTFGFSDAEPAVAIPFIVRGADPDVFLDVPVAYAILANTAAPDPPAATPATTNALALVLSGCVNATGVDDPVVSAMTGPLGYTKILDATFGAGAREPSLLAFFKVLASTAEENPAALSGAANANNDWSTYTIILRQAAAMSIASVGPLGVDTVFDNEIRTAIVGAGFEALQGTGKVYLNDADDLNGNEVVQIVESWSDTLIKVAIDKGGIGTDGLFLFVVNASADKTSIPVTVRGDAGGAPQLRTAVPPQQFEKDVPFSLDINVYLFDSGVQDVLSYGVTGLPGWLGFDGERITGAVPGGAAAASPYIIDSSCTDIDGNVVHDIFSINVSLPLAVAYRKTAGAQYFMDIL